MDLHPDPPFPELINQGASPMTESHGSTSLSEPEIRALQDELHRLRTLLAQKEESLTRVRQDKDHLHAIIERAPDIIMRLDATGRHLFINRAIEAVVPMAAQNFIGKTHRELGFPDAVCRFWKKHITAVFETGDPREGEAPYESMHGKRVFNWRLIPEYGPGGQVESVLCMARDITAQRRVEEDYAKLFASMPYGFALHEMVLDGHGRAVDYVFLNANPAFERLTGLKVQHIRGRRVREVLPATEIEWITRYARVALHGEPLQFESFSRALGKFFEVTAYSPAPGQFVTLFHDVTRRKQAEEDREKLKNMLSQAEKMNAIGRLAGGVAHDFNNKLSIITGYADFALEMTEPDSDLHQDLLEILNAAQSAAVLTRQLLTFARKEKTNPSLLDINASLEGMLSMLKRLIGENIELSWRPASSLWPVRMDAGQLDQILANLCINARDAIQNTGIISIETQNTSLGHLHCAGDPELKPGDYVQITVSDNGSGMTPDILIHIFEPFFTTKGTEQGTGLGLATVYGIVKQNHGLIRVYSEPNLGSSFKVYLPRHEEGFTCPPPKDTGCDPCGGKETLLLVEDDPGLLALNKTMLERLGYQVLTAALPGEALLMAENCEGAIDLMITDVIMPEMNGMELAELLSKRYPTIRCLFMSGYTQAMIAQQGFLEKPEHFIHKPFSLKELALKVRDLLDS
jgi:PAS domain S-box-containing protein